MASKAVSISPVSILTSSRMRVVTVRHRLARGRIFRSCWIISGTERSPMPMPAQEWMVLAPQSRRRTAAHPVIAVTTTSVSGRSRSSFTILRMRWVFPVPPGPVIKRLCPPRARRSARFWSGERGIQVAGGLLKDAGGCISHRRSIFGFMAMFTALYLIFLPVYPLFPPPARFQRMNSRN